MTENRDRDRERQDRENQRHRESMNGKGDISCSGNLSSEWEGSSLRAVEAIFSRQDLHVGGDEREGPGPRHLMAALHPELC